MGLNCRDCDAVMQRERGCLDRGLVPFELDGERVFRCPVRLVEDGTWQYLKAYAFYKKGLLPNGHSWLAETQKFIEAMFALDGEYAKVEQEQIDKVKTHDKRNRA